MPNKFGRVFRVGVRSNPDNPLATQLFIVSRSSQGNLVTSPDSLKDNLSLFLDQNRLISDAIDIMDSPITNIGVTYSIVVNGISNKNIVLQQINSSLKKYFTVTNFQIDQPVFLSEIQNIILNTAGVISLSDFKLTTFSNSSSSGTYSDVIFNIEENTFKGIVSPPPGGIFEIKYPDDDIIGVAE